MSEFDRFDEKFKQAAESSPAAPIRWDRVASKARRRGVLTLLGLLLFGLALTVVLAIGLIAGKTALDPSFSPPIISDASASLEARHPTLGRGLVPRGEDQARGYVVQANLEVDESKGSVLFIEWKLREVDGSKDRVSSSVHLERYVPHSDNETRMIRDWLPMPRRSGEYVVEINLESFGGGTLASSRSAPFFVVGSDCCRAYRTPSYVASLPSGWQLEEDYEPNPEERFVTLARGPRDSALVIDTSAVDEYKHRNALDNANELEDLLSRNAPGYRRIGWRVSDGDGGPIVEWSYEVEGAVSTDILFYRGDWGFAVLGRSEQPHFRETRDLARAVVRSIIPVK